MKDLKNDANMIVVNKNRGWRGLAKLQVMSSDCETLAQMIFSFSQDVWDDLMNGIIVIPTQDMFYVILFDNTEALPQGHQRSVLIKNFTAKILDITEYSKKEWKAASNYADWTAMANHVRNKNNHTQSDWNCIGIRVTPEL